MRNKYEYKIKNENGFSLVMVVVIFFIVSLLGMTILSVTASEHRLTRIDSRRQSVYYVAESGIHHMYSMISNELAANYSHCSTKNEFFTAFETDFLNKEYIFDEFEPNFGEQPIAKVNIELIDSDENYRDYRIESVGNIGGSKRTVNTIITLSWVNQTPVIDDLLLYTKGFEFQGSNMYGPNGTTVSDGIQAYNLNFGNAVQISTMYFNGPVSLAGSTSLGNKDFPGTLYINGDFDIFGGTRNIYGDVRVNGTLMLKDAILHGNVYVDGDLILGRTPVIHQRIYYTGDISHPNNYSQSILDKCIKVDRVDPWEVPVRNLNLREDNWYQNNGYEIKGNTNSTVPDNARWLVNNYDYTGWPKYDVNDGYLENVVIVSKGDIRINTATKFTGALIAPNGEVELPQGGTLFEGVIVSKNGVDFSGGGSNATLKLLQDLFSENEIPLIFTIPNESGDGGNSGAAGSIELDIRSGIKEN